MLPGSFVGGDVRELTTYALVNGVRREVESFTSDRDLAGDLPEQVAAGGGVSGGSGTIVWAQLEDVQSREVSPWHKPAGWPPSSGDRVQVYVTDGVTDFPRFTGVIDKSSGTVGGGMQSTVIDDRDRLNASFTLPALLRHHVPHVEGGEYRSIGLSYWFILVAALRRARIFNTPAAVAEIAVSVPLQGSVWPEAGTLTDARGLTPGTHAAFREAPWGFVGAGFLATYIPRVAPLITEPLLIGVMLPTDADSTARPEVNVSFGANRIRLRAVGRTVYGMFDGVTVVTLTAAALGDSRMVSLLVKGGVWTLSGSNGGAVTASHSVTGSSGMSLVEINATYSAASAFAGVQVSTPASAAHETAYNRHTPSMRFTPGNLASTMDMSPRIENHNVADLVDEICKATLTAAWWDESGVLQLAPADKLRSGTPTQTITTLDDITELGWEDSLLSVRSSVEVSWKDPSISKGRYQRKELFRGPGDTMEAQDNIEVFATPDDSTEWFGVDRNPRLLDDDKWAFYNRKRGSFMGVYYMNSSDEELPTSSKSTTITVETIGTVALKVSHVAGAYGTGVEANLGTSENSPSLRQQLRGQSLPVIRGFGEGKRVDTVHVSSITGPSYAPALSHDLGNWGHRYVDGDTVARRISDFIAQQVTAPTPTLSGVGVLYDPRRQLGDVITIHAGILDVTIVALVVGIGESHAPGDHSQDLTLRIISLASSRKVTYDELEASWSGSNYAALETVWAGLNYQDFENDPLEGAPNQ